MNGRSSERKIEKIIDALGLERPLSYLPRPLRFAVARKRYGWIDSLAALEHSYDDRRSLIEPSRLNTIFVHIPKAAGMSVSDSLFSSHGGAHTPLFAYLALYGSFRFDRMFKFTFVRHPLDRAASAYRFLRKGGLTEMDRIWAETHLHAYKDFNHFVCEGLPREEIRDWIHFRPQLYFLGDPRSKKIGVDFIGRFENLQADFAFVTGKLGVDACLTHTNQSGVGNTKVSHEAKRMVEDIYEADFSELGY